METIDKQTDKPTIAPPEPPDSAPDTPVEPTYVDVSGLQADAKPPKEDDKPKAEKAPERSPLAMPVILGTAAIAAAGLVWVVTTWGIWVAIFLAVLVGFFVFMVIGWNVSRQHKKRQNRRSSSGTSSHGSSGFGKPGSKAGSRNRPGGSGSGSKTGFRNRKAGSKSGSQNQRTGSKGGSGNQRAGSPPGFGGAKTGSRNQKTGTRTGNQNRGPSAKRTPGVSKNRNGSGVGSKKPNSTGQSARSGGFTQKAKTAGHKTRKAAKATRKGGRKFWEGSWVAGEYAGHAARSTGHGLKDAVDAIKPVPRTSRGKSDRTDDTQPSDNGRTVNDPAVQTAKSPTPTGGKPVAYNPIAAQTAELEDLANRYNLGPDANLYNFSQFSGEMVRHVAKMFAKVADRGSNENSAATQTAVEGLFELSKALEKVSSEAEDIWKFVSDGKEYNDYMARLHDPNGSSADVDRAHREAY